jgi:hypothetical protein
MNITETSQDEKEVLFNSFPRCGNIYSSGCYSAFFSKSYAALHMPEILGVSEVANVTVFRRPDEVMASLLYNQINFRLEDVANKTGMDYEILIGDIESKITENIKKYKKYIEYATKHHSTIYVADFNDLINDTVLHFENVAKFFELTLNKDYKENFNKLSFNEALLTDESSNGNLWINKYFGHIPREKDQGRLFIEDYTRNHKDIQDLNKEYQDFMGKYKTVLTKRS